MEKGDAPRDGGAPIVTSQKDAVLAELIGDGENVGSQMQECVGGRAAGFAAFVVAALVGNDYAEADGGKRIDLLVPGIPEFGEAVEEDHYGAVGWASGDGVEFYCAVVKGQVFENGRHRCRVYP